MLLKPKKLRQVYLDHAAATPLSKEVFQAMEPFFVTEYGNPSALYKLGLQANEALNNARRTIAQVLHALPDNIIFTSGGTEANNLAVFGVVKVNPHPASLSQRERGIFLPPHLGEGQGVRARLGHIISTPIEHHSVLNPLKELEKQGYEVTYIKVDKHGLVNPRDVVAAIRPNTVLISIMYANNEIGTIEPIAEIGRQLLRYRKEKGTVYPYFHTDACQAAGYLDLDVEKLHVDLMTINGSKIYGPKGVGMLYVRRGVQISPLIVGGAQEKHLRAGTENVPGIIGLARALEIAQKQRNKEIKKQRSLSEYFYKKLITNNLITNNSFNGPEIGERRLPNNLNVIFPGVEAEKLLLYLDSFGISCSAGSACAAEEGETSHVLGALGLSEQAVKSSLRFSLGRTTAKLDILYCVKILMHTLVLLK